MSKRASNRARLPAIQEAKSSTSLRSKRIGAPSTVTASSGNGVARVVAESVSDPDEIADKNKLVLLVKLEDWNVLPLEMLGFIEEHWWDDELGRDRYTIAAFRLLPRGKDYRLEFTVDSEEVDDEEDTIQAIFETRLQVGTRFCLVRAVEDEPEPYKIVFEVRGIQSV